MNKCYVCSYFLIQNNAGLIQICSRSDPFYDFSQPVRVFMSRHVGPSPELRACVQRWWRQLQNCRPIIFVTEYCCDLCLRDAGANKRGVGTRVNMLLKLFYLLCCDKNKKFKKNSKILKNKNLFYYVTLLCLVLSHCIIVEKKTKKIYKTLKNIKKICNVIFCSFKFFIFIMLIFYCLKIK